MLFAGESERKIILPSGNWYDFYTGKYVGNQEVITIPASHREIPIFVRNGAIIPLLEQPDIHSKDLEIRHYGNLPGTFNLYDDDGNTFAYESGNFCWIKLSVSKPDGNWQGLCKKASGVYSSEYYPVQWQFSFNP